MPDEEWERLRQLRISPDCAAGKHVACSGDAWDMEADTPADCECDCHTPARDVIRDLTARTLEEHTDEISTHWAGCWKYHAACLARLIQDQLERENP